jgi:hypothetical protein
MTGMTRPLTDDETSELGNLTAAVLAAIEARRIWLDAKMRECSRLQVGDDIYNVNTGTRLGKISKLYQYWRDRDEGVRDTSHYCDYHYQTHQGCFDNTSRQIGVSFGTREDAARYADKRARSLHQ